MNRFNWKCTLIGVLLLGISGWANAGDDGGMRESVQVSDLHVFGSGELIDGATILVRDFSAGNAHATVTTRGLEPETAYSIWWAVFNYPAYCAKPFACAVTDLEVFGGDPKIKASVFWGGGFIADAFGYANTALVLPAGRTSRELFGQTSDYGLQNLHGAEIHVVLRSHGEAGVAGPVATQIGTAMGACPPAGCVNAFFSVHSPKSE